MNRRETFKAFTGAATGMASLAFAKEAFAQSGQSMPQPAAAGRDRARAGGVPALKITDIKVFNTKVGGTNLINVKVYTSEPGLTGIGCGTHAERPTIVADTIEQYLKPYLIGRNADEIEKLWQELWIAPYWRASVDANNAMSAIDGALWDIMGKRCGVPVYDLLGGKVRTGLRMLGDVQARSPEALEDGIRKMMADGYDHFRIYLGGGGEGGPRVQRSAGGGSVGRTASGEMVKDVHGNDAEYIHRLVSAFDTIRTKIGWDIEIGHDVHERPTPRGAVMLAKAVEQYRPFFIEDLFAPEDVEWYKIVREQSSIGIAMGELFVNQNEWLPLVANRYIDLMRMHISAAGGLNLARKVAHTCEFFGVQTAWHGPANVSPVGHAVNMHVDLSIINFGICEGRPFTDQLQELFPGCPEIRKGIRYSNDKPGLGIDLDEKVAAKFKPDGNFGSERGAQDPEGAPRRP
ncbi:MAG TPA: enolase C-terminal domain-like protein [Rhizomicrobium sp.]